MSLLNLILLSTTPIAGLVVLLGIDRFEKYVLEDRSAYSADEAAADAVIDASGGPVVTASAQSHRAAA